MSQNQQYKKCIDACLRAVSICNQTAYNCLSEDNALSLKLCIQLNLECAVICSAAAQVMCMNGRYAEQLCRMCAEICQACGDECAKHSSQHCRLCAEACYQCAEECMQLTEATV
ncbi:MAG: four-helix bundle copper-binding protein [Sphingobacteriales bacterium]|nr:MAG: four-helix bundle copper-binding protein [Sphingobacteriales bacterium]